MLREYQQRSIDQLYAWFEAGNKGNPCLVLPTGSGKSHIVAALCKDAVQKWPETRILMLTHQKELIEQNSEKMRQHWPNAPMGIYSASIGRRCLSEPITFAGIQSVRNKSSAIGHIDLCIIDECHLVSHKEEGGYRTLLSQLKEINPALRVIGLTATPYRLGHGLITDKPALFDDLIEPVTIEELVYKGYLSVLRSKVTNLKLSVEGVHKRGGEYIESELQAAVDTNDNNVQVVSEIIRFGADRKSWLIFCAGVDHSEHIAELLQENGIIAECITGKTPKAEREQILAAFKRGEIRALTNAQVLTTGFDAPGIDLIAMLRPTMSASLYCQMAGRGLRIAPDKKDCLVLDFAGAVQTHGPITAIKPPKRGGDGTGEAPVKVCDECGELVHPSVMICPECGTQFPEPVKKVLHLRDDDIMGNERSTLEVTSWGWRKHTSRSSGKEMLAVTYYGALSDKPITEYLPVAHDGFAGQKAMRELVTIERNAGAQITGTIADDGWLDSAAVKMSLSQPPVIIEYRMEGKYPRVLKRKWKQ